MANEPAPTLSSAPRDIEGLKALKPYARRLIATQLGALATPELLSAWHQLQGPEQQAQYVLQYLIEWDKKNTNGVNGAAHATPAVPAGVPTAVSALPASAVAAVRPDATAAAAAAAVDKPKATTKRQPAPPANGVPVGVGAPTQSSIDLGAAVLEKLDALTHSVKQLTEVMNGLSHHISSRDEKTSIAFQSLSTEVAKLTQLQTWMFTTLLTVGENQIGATPLDLLRSAATDSNMLESLVKQVQEELGTTGK